MRILGTEQLRREFRQARDACTKEKRELQNALKVQEEECGLLCDDAKRDLENSLEELEAKYKASQERIFVLLDANRRFKQDCEIQKEKLQDYIGFLERENEDLKEELKVARRKEGG
jgi:hypothetical protein